MNSVPRPSLSPAHVYTVNGYAKVGVTTALGEYVKIERYNDEYYVHVPTGTAIPADIFEKAQRFGSAAHKAAYFLLTGKGLKWDRLNPALVATLRQLQAWIDKYKPQVKLCEVPLYSQIYDYCGTEDFFGAIEGSKHMTLVDLKTGVFDVVAGQLAAYEQLVRENTGHRGIIDKYVLYLPKDGSDYEFIRIVDREAFQFFLAKLFAYKYQRKIA